MAKKKKEEKDEDINQDAQGDINEADDNFGLPDVDYEPINREEDSETAETEETEDYANEDTSAQSDSGSTYVPGSYTPPKDDSMAPKIIGLILVLILAGGAIWWFGFESPKRAAAEKAKIEQQKQDDERQRQEAAAAAERQRQEDLAAQREAEALAAEEAKPETGTIETISARNGRYFVVIASALDDDLALDYAEKKKKEGISTYIINPFGKSKFHRVAISNHGTWNEAQAEANDLKSEYGEGVWVIKY